MAICGGDFTVWAFVDIFEGLKDQTNFSRMQWVNIRDVDSWNLVPDIQEAPRKRTSSTAGLAIKHCPDIVGFDVEITTTIGGVGDEQWLYGVILRDPRVPGVGVTAWFFLGFSENYNPHGAGGGGWQAVPGNNKGADTSLGILPLNVVETLNPIATVNEVDINGNITSAGLTWKEPGFYVYGTVNPPGFTGENDGQDPTTGEWSINIDKILFPLADATAAAPDYYELDATNFTPVSP